MESSSKKVLKSVKIWQNHGHASEVQLFRPTLYAHSAHTLLIDLVQGGSQRWLSDVYIRLHRSTEQLMFAGDLTREISAGSAH